MMIHADASEIVFAGAGAVWGAVTFFHGFQVWRQEHRHHRVSASISKLPLSAAKDPLFSSIVTGAAVAVMSLGYLIWSLHLFHI
jgi:hypothetical protein